MVRSPALLVTAGLAMTSIFILILMGSGQISGAITIQDQAAYEIGLTAGSTCDPRGNPYVDSAKARQNCCSQHCFTPCMTAGIPDCESTCKLVCMGKPIYK